MADNNKTSWIFELIDKVTAPMRTVNEVMDGVEDTIKDITARFDEMDEASRDAAKQAISDHKNLTDLIEKETKEVARLKAMLESVGDDPLSTGPIDFNIKEAETKIRRYKEQLTELQHELDEISKKPDAKKIGMSWKDIVVLTNQAIEVAQKFGESMDFAQEIDDTRRSVQLMSGTAGDELDRLTEKAYKLGNEFGDAPAEVAKSANAMVNQLGISWDDALSLIEQGYLKGANLNGDMLHQLEEYSTHLKQAGMSGSESIALMAQAGKQGIFDDKAVDAIKEANLSLREMGPAQIEALKGIGLEVENLAGKTTTEAIRMISSAMDGKTIQQKQLVLADIFKGAGEDAGLQFIEGFKDMDFDLSKLPEVERAGSGIRGFLLDMELWFSESMGSIAITMGELSGPVQTIAGFIPIITALGKVSWIASIATKAMSVATWLWNTALAANPIVWVVTAVVGLVAAVVWAYNEFDTFRAVIDGLGATAVRVFETIWSYLKLLMAPIRIVVAFLTEGPEGAAEAMKNIKQDAVDMVNGITDVASGEAFRQGYNNSLQRSEEKRKAEEDGKANPELGVIPGGEKPVLDGNLTQPGGKRQGLGIDGSGSGGNKSITMTLTINNNFPNVRNAQDGKMIGGDISNKVNDRVKDLLVNTA